MKNIIITLLVIIIVGSGIYFLMSDSSIDENALYQNEVIDTTLIPKDEPLIAEEDKSETIIGKSVEGRNVTAYHYGTGDTEILFIGGIHGGYEWNTTLLAREASDYLKINPNVIPANIKVTIISVLNPDGLNKVVGTADVFKATDAPTVEADTIPGRFNANEVDLNRNFDCDWEATGTWRNKTVSGGSQAFSEPEAQALRNYVETHQPKAVVVWYSAGGGVYASSCNNIILTETSTLTKTYATASGYKGYEEFDSYAITGDIANWLAKINIPAISVLLTNHSDTEWSKNLAGIEAVLKLYAK